MKRIHLLRVEDEASRFEALVAAIGADGGRVGWLDLEHDAPAPPALAAPAALGCLRAVAVGPRLSVAVKPRRGAPVLRDLLREHFRGCRLVLVAGSIAEPLLSPDGDGWTVRTEAGSSHFSTDRLVASLRRPRPDWVAE